MYWERMTIDEFAACQKADGLKVIKVGDVWWVEIRPFFFRPLLPFAEIQPWQASYPMKSALGGLLHVVPPGVTPNTMINFFVYDDLQGYCADVLSPRRKKILMQGLERFEARVITDHDEFVESAHGVYLSFYNRTNYSYKNERVAKESFRIWALNLFSNPKILKLGAYYEGRLTAVEISYHVEDVIIGDTLFTDQIGRKLNVTDFVLHKLREAAAATDARYFFLGFPSGVASLDESKLIRGSKLLQLPAYCRINPVALSVAKVFMKSSYQKLLDMTNLNIPQGAT